MFSQAPDQWDNSLPQVLWNSSPYLSSTGWHDKEMSNLQTSTATRLILPKYRSAVQLFQMLSTNSREVTVSLKVETWIAYLTLCALAFFRDLGV